MTTLLLIALAILANLELFLHSSWKNNIILFLAIAAVMFAMSRLNRLIR